MKKKDIKKLKYIASLLLLIIIGIAGYFGFDILNLDDIPVSNTNTIVESIPVDNASLQIYYFDVGQADSTLILNNGETMLIDAGNDADR